MIIHWCWAERDFLNPHNNFSTCILPNHGFDFHPQPLLWLFSPACVCRCVAAAQCWWHFRFCCCEMKVCKHWYWLRLHLVAVCHLQFLTVSRKLNVKLRLPGWNNNIYNINKYMLIKCVVRHQYHRYGVVLVPAFGTAFRSAISLLALICFVLRRDTS